MVKKIILDCDPGHDDAFAVLLALASPELEVLGITAVGGNVPLYHTERNARILCQLAGKPAFPVYAGASGPLVRALETAEHIHGNTGMDRASGTLFDAPVAPLQPQHAVDFIIDTCRAHDGVTLVPTGPLTNIALALRKAPDIMEHITEIVLMGGVALDVGNVTPAAEFNIYVDPHAADIVFRSGIPIVMFGLDVTHKMLVDDTIVARVAEIPRLGEPLADLLRFFNRYDRARYNSCGAPLHDPCTIAYLIDPALFTGKSIHVEVELVSELTMGMTVADWWNARDLPANAQVMVDGDRAEFFDLLIERIASLQ